MLSLVVAVLLSGSPEEPKILKQAPEQVRGIANPAFDTPAHELKYLKSYRPNLDWSAVILGTGAVITGVGVALIIMAFASAGSGRDGGGYLIIVGGPVAGLGALIGIGGGIAMGMVGAEQTRVDTRIRQLEAQLAPPPSVRIPIIPPVVLARF
jgi:hypothetical protein